MEEAVLAFILILYFILCYFVVIRAERYFNKLYRNAHSYSCGYERDNIDHT